LTLRKTVDIICDVMVGVKKIRALRSRLAALKSILDRLEEDLERHESELWRHSQKTQ